MRDDVAAALNINLEKESEEESEDEETWVLPTGRIALPRVPNVPVAVRPRDGRAAAALSDDEEEPRPTVGPASPDGLQRQGQRVALQSIGNMLTFQSTGGRTDVERLRDIELREEREQRKRQDDRKRMRIEDAPPPQPQPQPQPRMPLPWPLPRSLCGPGPYLGPY